MVSRGALAVTEISERALENSIERVLLSGGPDALPTTIEGSAEPALRFGEALKDFLFNRRSASC